MLPRVNGYEICRDVRARGLDMPILMLTAKGQEEDIILGLNGPTEMAKIRIDPLVAETLERLVGTAAFLEAMDKVIPEVEW
jgi:CheY-like chemotaxis protein